MAELTGIPIPTINWKASDLPEEFRKFKQTCEFIFNGPLAAKSEEIKVQYLMLWVGDDGRDIREGWKLTADDKKKLDDWTRFEAYTRPKSNFRVAQFQLRALRQEESETIDAFITRAKVLASQCEFKNTTADWTEDELLDTLIAGVRSESIQRKLISKEKDLTLDSALKLVRAIEATQKQMTHISDIHPTKKVSAISAKPRRAYTQAKKPNPGKSPLPKGKCWNCGGDHLKSEHSPAAKTQCHYCKKVGHYIIADDYNQALAA